jgi:hypothetical protein
MNGTISSTPVFTISCQVGGVIYLTLQLCLQNSLTGVGASVSTAALGSGYYLALDGPTSNRIQPIGLPTTH